MDELVAVILARGLASRMRQPGPIRASLSTEQHAAATAGLKAMMPMGTAEGATRPFLDYVLSTLADAGFRDVVLVVAPDDFVVRTYYEAAGRPARLRIQFAVQAEPRGTADAVRAAEPVVGARQFVVINGDNLYPVAALEALRSLEGPGLVAFERDALVASSHISPDRVAAFALLIVSADGRLLDVIEKPAPEVVSSAGGRTLVSMNCWRFDNRIFDACRAAPPSSRGEFELTTAVRLAIDRGVTFRSVVASGPVLDLTRRDDVAVVQAHLAGLDARP